MLIARDLEQSSHRAQLLDEHGVRVEDLQTLDTIDLRQEPPAIVDREDDRDSGGGAHELVVLAVGRRLVNDAGTLTGLDVVGDENLPCILGAVRPGIRVEVPQALVPDAGELAAGDSALDRGAGLVR